MSLIAKNESVEIEIPAPGVYTAICIWIIDLGMQETKWNEVVKLKRKVKLVFELVGTSMEANGKPFVVGNNFTLSLNEKSELYKTLVSWRGRNFSSEEMDGFDLKNVLGAGCQLNVIHNQSENRIYANIGAIMPSRKGESVPSPVNDFIFYDGHNHDEDVWNKIPEWIQNKINRPKLVSVENEPPAQPPVFEDDDIPF